MLVLILINIFIAVLLANSIALNIYYYFNYEKKKANKYNEKELRYFADCIRNGINPVAYNSSGKLREIKHQR